MRQPSAPRGAPALQVIDLQVEFLGRHGAVQANAGVSYEVSAGETLAILGESGSGKSVSAQAVMGLIEEPAGRITGGQILFRGEDLLRMPESRRRKIRGEGVSIVFQDALSALNPVQTVGDQIAEMFRAHRGASMAEGRRRAAELLDRVRIPSAKERLRHYPHEFSGGMRQRVMIAMAIALEPEVLIADEPTTALDVTVQAQIMALLKSLQDEFTMGLILITHDLGVVADVADRIAVMYAGRIVEQADVLDLYARPAHPYTHALLDSVPRLDQKGSDLTTIGGSPPRLDELPAGCAFHPRCRWAVEECRSVRPELRVVGESRRAACHRADEVVLHERY